MTIEQDFEAVREALEHWGHDYALDPLSRIEAVQNLATEQVGWLQRTKKEAERQRDALRAALEMVALGHNDLEREPVQHCTDLTRIARHALAELEEK